MIRVVAEKDIPTVLAWLGPAPVPAKRVNAKCREHMGRTLLHEALFNNSPCLMRILLQMGANVDALSTFRNTPLDQGCLETEHDEGARLLLTWGASTEKPNLKVHARRVNPKLADLLETPLGGRRCEIVGLQSRTDLNGKMGVATRYLAKKGRYIVQLEENDETDEKVQVLPINLIRRDRTPQDCGKIMVFVGVEENPGFNINFFTNQR